jgi:hypothetical protein
VEEVVVLTDAKTLNAKCSKKPPLIPVKKQRSGTTATTEVLSERDYDLSDGGDAELDEPDSGDVQAEPELPKWPGAGGGLALTSNRLLFHTQLHSVAGGRRRPMLM